MEKVVVKPDSLASLLVVNRELEEEAEEFRLQPKVNFVVDFNDYLKFIDKELNIGDYLSLPMIVLKKQVKLYQTEKSKASYEFLKRAFFKDMSMAILKELHFAERYGKTVSFITHNISGTMDYQEVLINKIYETQAKEKSEGDLIQKMYKKNYPIAFPVSESNQFALRYAVVLEFYASLGKTDWSFNKN